jgi:hypothetical protein
MFGIRGREASFQDTGRSRSFPEGVCPFRQILVGAILDYALTVLNNEMRVQYRDPEKHTSFLQVTEDTNPVDTYSNECGFWNDASYPSFNIRQCKSDA